MKEFADDVSQVNRLGSVTGSQPDVEQHPGSPGSGGNGQEGHRNQYSFGIGFIFFL